MREVNELEDLDSLLSSMTGVNAEEKKEIIKAVEVTAVKKARDEILPNIYAKTILWIFCAINVSVIVIVMAGFLVDSGFFGNPKSVDRFITSNVLMALITGVTIQVSYAIRTMTNFFFKAQENISEIQPELPPSKTP
jgi:hypothetical protein